MRTWEFKSFVIETRRNIFFNMCEIASAAGSLKVKIDTTNEGYHADFYFSCDDKSNMPAHYQFPFNAHRKNPGAIIHLADVKFLRNARFLFSSFLLLDHNLTSAREKQRVLRYFLERKYLIGNHNGAGSRAYDEDGYYTHVWVPRACGHTFFAVSISATRFTPPRSALRDEKHASDLKCPAVLGVESPRRRVRSVIAFFFSFRLSFPITFTEISSRWERPAWLLFIYSMMYDIARLESSLGSLRPNQTDTVWGISSYRNSARSERPHAALYAKSAAGRHGDYINRFRYSQVEAKSRGGKKGEGEREE